MDSHAELSILRHPWGKSVPSCGRGTARLAALKGEFNIFQLTLEIRAPYCLEGAARPAQEGVSWITRSLAPSRRSGVSLRATQLYGQPSLESSIDIGVLRNRGGCTVQL